MHATSVVPHAAFVNGKPFAGSFDDVFASPILKECFERDFAGTLPLLPADTLFIALGRTPSDALQWCVDHGLLRCEQLLGAFAHPSGSGGSRVGIYLGEKSPAVLNPRDPVRHSVDWLIAAAEAMRQAVVALGGKPRVGARAPASAIGSGVPVSDLHAFVTRGRNLGALLRPHATHGYYVVSPDNREENYIRVPVAESLEPYLARGLRLRMSGPTNHPPTLIAPASICGRPFRT
jgi:hypothetical protein